MRTDEVTELLRFPIALALLTQIALRARRTVDQFNLHNLKLGEALIGDYGSIGATEQQYRTAKRLLEKCGLITIKPTSKGTIARLSNLRVFDVNEQRTDQRTEQRTEQRLTRIQDVQEPKMSKKNQRDSTLVECPMVNKRTGGNAKSEAAGVKPVADADADWTRLKQNADFALKEFNGRITPGQDADPDNFYKPQQSAKQGTLLIAKLNKPK